MVNYGYGPGCQNWKESRKQLLAEKLSQELPAKIGWTPGGGSPYIEVDGLYPGVRIRKITNIATEDQKELIKRADKIYDEVMK